MDHEWYRETLVFLLAGGQGERLYPLTRDRSKPAVPFGGIYRIIDFSLSNCLNSTLNKIVVLTQYKSLSLDRHIKSIWNLFPRELGYFIDVVPPQQRIDNAWYQGTADAIFQNIYIIEMEKPRFVLVLSGDHVYRMDYRKLIRFHVEKNADMTISAIEIPCNEARRFGVLEVDLDKRIIGFNEKPDEPRPIPGKKKCSFISMGIYVFKTEKLVQYLSENHRREGDNDFGKDIIPRIFATERLFAYDYAASEGEYSYWRDIGTLKSYYESTMDLVAVSPSLNLYDRQWPFRTYLEQYPPAKMIFDDDDRRGVAIDTILSNGAIVSGSKVYRSVLSPGVKVNSYSEISDSIIMHGVDIGRNCRIKNTIIDKFNTIPEGQVIGYDLESDKRRFTVTHEGIVVIPKKYEYGS